MVARQREIPVPRPGNGPPASTRWLALAVLCVSLLIVNLDNTMLNVALPTLIRGPARDVEPAAVDRRCLCAGIRRAAAGGGQHSAIPPMTRRQRRPAHLLGPGAALVREARHHPRPPLSGT